MSRINDLRSMIYLQWVLPLSPVEIAHVRMFEQQHVASMHMSGRSADKRTKASFISQSRPREANSWVRATVVRLPCGNRRAFLVPFLRWDLRASSCTIPSTLDRSSIAVPYRDTAEPGFYFDSRSASREKSRTKSHACRTTRSNSHRTQSEAAGLIEYQGTINALRGNVDTLAQILQYIVTT